LLTDKAVSTISEPAHIEADRDRQTDRQTDRNVDSNTSHSSRKQSNYHYSHSLVATTGSTWDASRFGWGSSGVARISCEEGHKMASK